MTAMPTEALGLPRGRDLTRDDLDAMPDDGYRYELIDGILIVSPAPRRVHQRAVGNLYLALRQSCPADLEVLLAPFDVALSDDTVMQPDLLVASRSATTERDLPSAPLLAIEVLSPSTRSFDLLLKKDRLRRAGCPHYWVVDPGEPSILAWELADGEYRETAHVIGDDTFTVEQPLPLSVVPAELGN
ncbi:MAG: Uma2 family endonuclease [Gordonia sp.]|uniref:Uma2 family endonuclease n=1 Tax=Gordonia sp. (in: high G+C Gram-positive bacteria) TaxID=84139 RepID=UPI001D53715A|nr:Uma2 family endonuclease [Gordonia sp. (in: high G+C Gram-positive bacteria)]MCB1297030.1 Uma2 family endonuclease [Gordonia sp. (in: high G+C Gram-positive bacteria)]